jgi:hypothetical protein
MGMMDMGHVYASGRMGRPCKEDVEKYDYDSVQFWRVDVHLHQCGVMCFVV